MVDVALPLELDLQPRESAVARWSRAHSTTLRGLLSLIVVGSLWEIAGRTGRWPLILAPVSDIWSKFIDLTASGELTRHVLVSLNEFFVGLERRRRADGVEPLSEEEATHLATEELHAMRREREGLS